MNMTREERAKRVVRQVRTITKERPGEVILGLICDEIREAEEAAVQAEREAFRAIVQKHYDDADENWRRADDERSGLPDQDVEKLRYWSGRRKISREMLDAIRARTIQGEPEGG